VGGGPGSSRGVNAMRDFLEFCQTRQVPDRQIDSGRPPGSEFEVAVGRVISEFGLRYVPQVGVAGFFIDIGVLARQGSQIGSAMSPGALPPQEPALRIFVTLDIPLGSLRRLVDQAERSGAVLVLRGLKNQSMRQTVAAVSDLLGERKAGWVIDPEAFERHGVEAAPTFLLTTGEDAPPCSATTCTVPRPFISVSGDVSLDYALEHMARRQPGAAAVAGPYLSRLRPR